MRSRSLLYIGQLLCYDCYANTIILIAIAIIDTKWKSFSLHHSYYKPYMHTVCQNVDLHLDIRNKFCITNLYMRDSLVQVLDDKNVRRRFRASNYQSTTRVKPFICTMPMRLDDGWNQIQFNLSDFTRRAYGTNYIETLRVQVSCKHLRSQVFDPCYTSKISTLLALNTFERHFCSCCFYCLSGILTFDWLF